MKTDAQKVAEGLSKAAKRAICQLSGEHFTPWNRVYRQRRQRINGHALGLHEPERMGPITMWCNIRLTPLGLEVRAILQEKAGG